MLIRLVVPVRHPNSHCLTGVFQEAYRLRSEGRLDPGDRQHFEGLRRWFNRHLPVPTRLSRSRRPHARGTAVCWLKPEAAEHLARLRELAAVLERQGVRTEVLRTNRPGYVVYEDQYQVAAVPFRGTRA